MNDSHGSRLRSLAQVFLRLGTFGFGGPQAHMALQHQEAVARRGWLTEEEFTDGIILCELLPGPASTQLGIYIGYVRGGFWGAIVAGVCFIAPAFLIVVVLSWSYFQFQHLPQVAALLQGISPVMGAIVLAFCWTLGQKALNTPLQWAIAGIVFLSTWLTPLGVLAQFFLAGLVGYLWLSQDPKDPPKATPLHASPVPPDPADPDAQRWSPENPWKSLVPKPWSWLGAVTLVSPPLTGSEILGFDRIQAVWLPLSLFFLKVGSFIFGGGLVIIPLLEFELVQRLQWLTTTEFVHGVAIGQLSPGPVVLTAAFVGYKVSGCLGALVATIAIFLPSFLFILLMAPLIPSLRHHPGIKACLRGITPAVLGTIGAASFPLMQVALVQPLWSDRLLAIIILGGSLWALIRYKTPAWQLIVLGGILGLMHPS